MKNKSKLPEKRYKFFRPILGLIYRIYYNPKIIGKEKETQV